MRTHKPLSSLLVAVVIGLLSVIAAIPQQATADEQKTATSATQLYTTAGHWSFNNRAWHTHCTQYSSSVERCQTNIWATVISYENGRFSQKWAWAFNNLTYKASPRASWEAWNVLVTPGDHDSGGRKWKTQCNTEWTGLNACRSQILSTTPVYKDGRYQVITQWVFNNIVHLTPVPCPVSEKQLADVRKEPSVISTCLQSKIDPNWLAVQYPVMHKGALFQETAFFNRASGGWAHKASGGLHISSICQYYQDALPHAFDLADTITYCHNG